MLELVYVHGWAREKRESQLRGSAASPPLLQAPLQLCVVFTGVVSRTALQQRTVQMAC
jgi:hypothetical protein